ncbi:hypothetical protein ACFWJT_14750 [Streptomyces sp. NPDC127069]
MNHMRNRLLPGLFCGEFGVAGGDGAVALEAVDPALDRLPRQT